MQSAIGIETNGTALTGKDHIDHSVKITGANHVGIGSDFDGVSEPPNGLEVVSKMPALIAVLLKRGYDCGLRCAEILGENHLRVIREVTGK